MSCYKIAMQVEHCTNPTIQYYSLGIVEGDHSEFDDFTFYFEIYIDQ